MTVQEATSWCNEQIGHYTGDRPLSFFNLYYQLLTGRNPLADGVALTNAADAWASNPSGFTKHLNDPDNADDVPPQGSIMFWSDSVVVVDYASATTITVWEETYEGVQHKEYNRLDRQELGWWTWENFSEAPSLEDEVIADDPAPDGGAPEAKPETTYIWVAGDSIWEVARRLGLRAMELLEHNDIDDPRTIKPGDVLHLPLPREVSIEQPIRIEPLPEPRRMHTVKSGVRKWSFGYAHATDDLHETGPTYAQDANIDILAMAHVPMGDDTIDFYMERVAVGNYHQTGRVQYTIGFRPDDLDDGYVEHDRPPLPKAMAVTVEKIAEQLENADKPVLVTNPLLKPTRGRLMDVSPRIDPTAYKATIHPIYSDRRTIRYFFKEAMTIEEADGRADPHAVLRYDDPRAHYVDARTAYYIDNDEYVLPLSHEQDGLWWKIPRDMLIEEADRTIELASRQVKPKVTFVDRFWWAPLAWLNAQHDRYTKRK